MANYETKTWLVVLQMLLLIAFCMQHCVNGIVTPEATQVPCLFIFSDSVSDNGNNNLLTTTAKANYKPYGIDFVEGPSGRFTNGLTSIDIIGQLLGFVDFIPPFANTTGSNITKGVNYASGSGGIRNESGKNLGANIPLGQQIQNHRTIITQITAKLGGLSQAQNYLKKCIYYVNIGSNDYINNYFMPQKFPTSRIYNPQQYAQVLVSQFSTYLQVLRSVGARKFVINGLGQIGCTPQAIATAGINGTCAQYQNDDTLIFSHNLRSLVDQLNLQYKDSKFIFVNATAGTLDSSLGFTNVNGSCCPISPDDGMCVADSIPCPNRDEFIFYDGFHTTQAVNRLSAFTAYDSSSSPGTTYPIDIKRLAQYVNFN